MPLEKVRAQVLSCGYGHTAVIIGGALYTWGLSDYGVLGHGPRSNTSPKLLTGMGITLPEDQEVRGAGAGEGRPHTHARILECYVIEEFMVIASSGIRVCCCYSFQTSRFIMCKE